MGRALVDHGVDVVFGVMGDANLFVVDAMVRQLGTRYVAAAHEASAVLMAEGFARVGGRLGVATVTHGPGLTNAFTALVEGTRNRTPLLLVTGDTAVEDVDNYQDIAHGQVVDATGAGFQQVRSGPSIGRDVAQAVRRAHVERRPIVLNIPVELMWADVDYIPEPRLAPDEPASGPSPEVLDRALGIVASANRPLILAGRGAVSAGARKALTRLAERLGAPVAATVLAPGFFRGEPCDLGVFGTLSTPVASEAIATADCLVVFGASLNYFTTSRRALLEGKRVVHVDVDASSIGRHVPVDAGVTGDARTVAEAMVALLDDAGHVPSGFRSDQLAGQLDAEAAARREFEDPPDTSALDPWDVTRRLDRLLPSERTVVVDGGRFMRNALTFPVEDPRAFVTTHGFGAIGLGMGNAIGAAIACSDRPTVLLIGDGGFMMGGMAEFHTAVRNSLDLIVVVFNDSCYGAEHRQFWARDMDPGLSLHEWPDLVAVATACGAQAVRVEALDDLGAVSELVEARSGSQPLLIDVALDPAAVSAMAFAQGQRRL